MVPALTALIGVWFLFDARADFADSTSSDEPDDMSASEVMLVMNHAHLVVEELKQGPENCHRTRRCVQFDRVTHP